MTGIEKKTAVITGAAGGIGQAISKQFIANGFRVIAGDADQAGLDMLEAELNRTGQNVWSKAGDLRNKAYCEELIDYSIQITGRLDVLVNNAGIITRGNILETTDEDWERTFDINLTSIFYTCRRAIGHMKGPCHSGAQQDGSARAHCRAGRHRRCGVSWRTEPRLPLCREIRRLTHCLAIEPSM